MDKNRRILETLQLQPLSDEEKASRHILGRLYGPIATCEESTRNGRKYNRELWERALNDEIFKEKVANKSLFLELGHPTDREETDMEKICACIPEIPKIVDGDLCAYVDILDTNNGRLLKTLCDYGFIPGISSRGSGDIMANDEVDPETFFLETWDIVQLPAVKKARLAMCESLDENSLKLKKALTESYEAATDADRKVMKESLDNLDIDIGLEEAKQSVSIDDIQWLEDEDPEESKSLKPLTEDSDDGEAAEEEVETEEIPEEEVSEDEAEEPTEETEEQQEEIAVPVDVAVEAVEAVADDIKEVVEADDEESEAIDEIVNDKVEELRPVEEETPAEEESEEDKEIEETETEEVPAEDTEAESIEEEEPEIEEPSEEAGDAGLDEWVSNLKEMIRQKDLLEAEVKRLKEEKTVSDAEVKKLKEELDYYKNSVKADDLVEKVSAFEKEVSDLHEQLAEKAKKINSLHEECKESHRLTESTNAQANEIKKLKENLISKQEELTNSENRLIDQRKRDKEKLTEAINVAKAYKDNYDKAIDHYIESKASMLGVKAADIVSKLHENYTCDDIDNVCDELLEAPQHFSNALFSDIKNGAKIAIRESVEPKHSKEEDDDFADLLKLAGLK